MVKEFKVGTIFELGRVLLRCTKGSDCTKCYFFDKGIFLHCVHVRNGGGMQWRGKR